MATFRIGQRVRIVRTDYFPQFMGMEAVIISGLKPHGKYGRGYDIDVDGVGRMNPGCSQCWVLPDQIEPLQPEGSRTVVSWEECPWQPEHLRQPA